jgi:membrane-associated phospholipid phosphatase
MPSSHSTAISFFVVYLQCVATPYILIASEMELVTAGLMLLLFHWFALGVMWSRVRLGHHTQSQVLAGMTLGGVCALLSFTMWQKGGLSKMVPEFLNQQLGLGWLLDLFGIQ